MAKQESVDPWFPADDVEVQKINVHEPEVIAKHRASFRFNTKAVEALAEVAGHYGLNRTPFAVRAALDPEDPNMICLRPAPEGTPHVMKIQYKKSNDVTVNMIKFCQHYHFVLPQQTNLAMTATPIDHPTLGWVLRLNFKAGTERMPRKRGTKHVAPPKNG